MGRARFEIEDDALLIEPLDGVGDDILLYPIDSVSLSAQVDASSAQLSYVNQLRTKSYNA